MLVVSSPSALFIPNDKANESAGNQNAYTGSPNQHPPESFWVDPTSDPVALFTAVLCVVTFGLFVFTGALWWVTYRLSRDAKESSDAQAARMLEAIAEAACAATATQDLARASAISAKAATASAEHLLVIERAYIYPTIVSDGNFSGAIDTAKVFFMTSPERADDATPAKVNFVWVIKNYGKTPAIIIEVYAKLNIGEVEHAGNEYVSIRPFIGVGEVSEELALQMLYGLTNRQAYEIDDGRQKVKIVGKIIYEDVWGVYWRTNFEFVWNGKERRMGLSDLKVKKN